MERACRPHLLAFKISPENTVLCWSFITPAMMSAWRVWNASTVCLCVFLPTTPELFVCARLHFCTACSPPLVLSQCLHPNHNYNVISRVRQCPCCCFTFSSSFLLWISNALMLRSESCTAPSQTHTRVNVWGAVGWVCLIVLFILWFWQEEPAAGPSNLKNCTYFSTWSAVKPVRASQP